MHTGRIYSVSLSRRWLPIITIRSVSRKLCVRMFTVPVKFRPQFCESCGAIYRRICEMFSALQSTSGPVTYFENIVQIDAKLATLSFLKLVRNWPKNAVLNLALCCGAIWRHIGAQLQSLTYTIAPTMFWKIYVLYDFWCAQTCSFRALFGLPILLSALRSDLRKILYRCTSTLSALNYCSGIFLKFVSYLYVVRTNVSDDFWIFRNFWQQFRETCGAR